MQGRQLLVVLLCGMILVPAHGVALADGASTTPQSTDEEPDSPESEFDPDNETPVNDSLPHNPANANVEVNVTSRQSGPLKPGEPMHLTVAVDAIPLEPIAQDVRLYVDGRYVETKTVEIPTDGMAEVDFEHDLPEYESAQEIPYRVEAGIATANGTYEVRGSGDPADASRDSPGPPDLNLTLKTDMVNLREVPSDGRLTVETYVENTENESVTEVVRLLLDGDGPTENQEISTQEVSLGPGERKVVGFWYEPPESHRNKDLPIQIEAGDESVRFVPHFHGPHDPQPPEGLDLEQLDRPSITLETVRTDATRNNTYWPEFTVYNPNDMNITADAEFPTGTTGTAAPELFEPGDTTFEAKWMPESNGERLSFTGNISAYGFDEPLTAETKPASYYTERDARQEAEEDADNGSDLAGAQEGRFDGCKYVEVDGEFGENHSIIPTITWYSELGDSPQAYGEYGLLGENFETPFNGTIIFEIVTPDEVADGNAEDGIIINESDDEIRYTIVEGNNTHGLGILGILSGTEYTETYGNYTFDNPNDCFNATQPDRPTASIDAVESNGDGTFDVTVVAENPNDANMTLRGGFIGSTTDADVKNDSRYMLEPGENNTYTATWTPNSPNERLYVIGDLSGYDYDDPLTVETDTAAEYGFDDGNDGVPEPRVVNVDADQIERGAPLNLTVEVVNEGNGTLDTEAVLFRQQNSRFIEEKPLELEPGERGMVNFTFGTETMNLDEQHLYQVRVGYYSNQSTDPSVETFDARQWVSEGDGMPHPSTIVQSEEDSDENDDEE